MYSASTEDVGEYRFLRQDWHPAGEVFYDVYGNRYLFESDSRKVSRMPGPPFDKMQEDFMAVNQGGWSARPAAVLSGSGTLHGMSRRSDPRELFDVEFYGELMYNMEADADMGYLILNGMCLAESKFDGLDGELKVRGALKRVAIIGSKIIGSKITIISDINPEIFIIDSDTSDSCIEIINNDGVPHIERKIYRSDIVPEGDDFRALMDYIRSNTDETLEEHNDDGNSNIAAGTAAACLALASLIAVSSKKNKKVESNVRQISENHQNNR